MIEESRIEDIYFEQGIHDLAHDLITWGFTDFLSGNKSRENAAWEFFASTEDLDLWLTFAAIGGEFDALLPQRLGREGFRRWVQQKVEECSLHTCSVCHEQKTSKQMYYSQTHHHITHYCQECAAVWLAQQEEKRTLQAQGLKRCTSCGEIKPISAYSRQTDYIHSQCKVCTATAAREHRNSKGLSHVA